MKLNPDFIKRQILDEIILVPTGEAASKFNGIITINEITAFIIDCACECGVDAIVDRVCEKYDVERETADADVKEVFNNLVENRILI